MFLTIASLLFIYLGIKYVLIYSVYLGSFTLGIGSALTFLPTIGYIKYFSPVYVSFYLAGLAFAGAFLGGFYLLALEMKFRFLDVTILFLIMKN